MKTRRLPAWQLDLRGLFALMTMSSVVLAVYLAFNGPESIDDREYRVLHDISGMLSDAEWDQMISTLESIPIRKYPFYERWMSINYVRADECWSDSGYDPSRSSFSRDLQLLVAMKNGKLGIDNGGFLQFFSSSTGAMAPEMIEWCQRAGLKDTAAIIQDATAIFGDDFPRSQVARQQVVRKLKGDDGQEANPFHKLDARFFDSFHSNDKIFTDAADRWLREVCGIKSLHDKPGNK